MSLGSWNPDTEQAKNNFQPDTIVLNRFISISQNQQLEQLAELLSTEEQQLQAGLMQLSKEQWFDIAQVFSDDEIEHLMQFFTMVEQLPGWTAGANSPVVWLGKILKQRGRGINRELLLWIKAHSDNRFLPHGAL